MKYEKNTKNFTSEIPNGKMVGIRYQGKKFQKWKLKNK